MQRFYLHHETPQKRHIREIIKILDQDGLVIVPTDSGYSLACRTDSPKAIRRMYQLKKKDKKYQMSIIVQSFAVITEFAGVDNSAFKTMKAHAPGPYTWILPATNEGRKLLEVKRPTMGIRFPKHPFFTSLAEENYPPLLSTSARIHDDEVFIEPDELETHYAGQVDALADMGSIPSLPTTIISMESGAPEVLRLGQGEFKG